MFCSSQVSVPLELLLPAILVPLLLLVCCVACCVRCCMRYREDSDTFCRCTAGKTCLATCSPYRTAGDTRLICYSAYCTAGETCLTKSTVLTELLARLITLLVIVLFSLMLLFFYKATNTIERDQNLDHIQPKKLTNHLQTKL